MKSILHDKRGKGMSGTAKFFLWLFGILAVIALLVLAFGTTQTIVGVSGKLTADQLAQLKCSDTRNWSGTVDVQNMLNVSGTETYDTTMFFYIAGTNTLKTSITDTTAGTVTLECGDEYDIEVVSTSGAEGDSARIHTASEGSVDANTGTATFQATGTGNRITFGMHQHGLPQVRAKDVINDGFMFAKEAATATEYNTTDGVNFTSTTDNSSATTVGESGEFHIIHFIKAQVSDQNYNDLGTYVLLDLASSVWDVPTVRIDGAVATEMKSQLNADELISYADYEYVYLIDKDNPITLNSEVSVSIDIFALGGVNPVGTNAPVIDYAPVGKYQSTTNTNLLKIGSVTDSSSKADVYTRWDTNTFIN